MGSRSFVHGLIVGLILSLSVFCSTRSAASEEVRPVIIINSSDDLGTVRVHVLGFKGGVASRDVTKDNEVEVNNILVGDRAVAVYDLHGNLIVVRKMALRNGSEPARIGVFGNKTDGYRLDFGL
jgi:hypothetical protein